MLFVPLAPNARVAYPQSMTAFWLEIIWTGDPEKAGVPADSDAEAYGVGFGDPWVESIETHRIALDAIHPEQARIEAVRRWRGWKSQSPRDREADGYAIADALGVYEQVVIEPSARNVE